MTLTANRDKDFFYEDRSADRFGGDDPYALLEETPSEEGPALPAFALAVQAPLPTWDDGALPRRRPACQVCVIELAWLTVGNWALTSSMGLRGRRDAAYSACEFSLEERIAPIPRPRN